MKTFTLALLVTGCALMHGIAHASNLESAQVPANSSAHGNSVGANVEDVTSPDGGEDLKKLGAQKRSGRAVGHNRIPLPHTSSIPGNHPKPAAPKPVAATNATQTSSGKLSAGAQLSPLFKRKTGAGIGAQQFQNKDRGPATSASIGGPATAKKSTAVINGTEVTRKH